MMAATAMQHIFVLYMLIPVTVCDAVYKEVNCSVQLDTEKEAGTFSDLTWIFNKSHNIVKYTQKYNDVEIYSAYKNKVEFNSKTYCLTLKNLKKNDSGLYEAKVSYDTDLFVAVHEVHVLDPVEKPVLNVSSYQSSDTCNVTLTCESQTLSVLSHCYSDTCDIQEVKTDRYLNLSLSLYVSNSIINCNHSNPVSWKNTSKKTDMKQLCPNEHKPVPIMLQIILPVTAILICIVIIIIIIYICYKKHRTMDSANTVYEEVDPLKKGGKNAQSVDMNLQTPCTVYCTVGEPAQDCNNGVSTISTANPGNQNQGAETKLDVSIPQTIYATVMKPVKIEVSCEN